MGYAAIAAAKHKKKMRQQLALDRSQETTWTYYIVPRELCERFSHRGAAWLDLVSAADVAGCRILRCTKRAFGEMKPMPVPDGYAAVYEGIPGAICIAKENW